MADDTIKIHAYRIKAGEDSATIETVLDQVANDSIADRERELSYAQVRVEDLEWNKDYNCYLMDFVLRRYEGPARSPAKKPNEDFNLDDTDRFGEETAALFDPSTKRLILQYNHRGVKMGRALEYLSVYRHDHDSFEGQFQMDPDFNARLKAHQTVPKALIATVVPGHISKEDRDNDLAARSAAKLASHAGGNTVKLEIAAQGKKENRLNERVHTMLKSLRKQATKEPESVPRLKYRGKTDPDEAAEVFDLLHKRLEMVTDELPISAGRRLSRPNRYDALLRALTEWRPLFNKP